MQLFVLLQKFLWRVTIINEEVVRRVTSVITVEERGALTLLQIAMPLILVFRLISPSNGERVEGRRVARIRDDLGRVDYSSKVTGSIFFGGVAGIKRMFSNMPYKSSQTKKFGIGSQGAISLE